MFLGGSIRRNGHLKKFLSLGIFAPNPVVNFCPAGLLTHFRCPPPRHHAPAPAPAVQIRSPSPLRNPPATGQNDTRTMTPGRSVLRHGRASAARGHTRYASYHVGAERRQLLGSRKSTPTTKHLKEYFDHCLAPCGPSFGGGWEWGAGLGRRSEAYQEIDLSGHARKTCVRAHRLWECAR